MRLPRSVSLPSLVLLASMTATPAMATEGGGYNLVGTWQCHNPVIVFGHTVVAEDVNYVLVIFDQIHQTFLGHYELDVSAFDTESGSSDELEERMPQADGMTIRITDDGRTLMRINMTGAIGPEPDRFYAIDHLSESFKIGQIDSSEHFSYVVGGLGVNPAAHNGYCVRTSRDQPDRLED